LTAGVYFVKFGIHCSLEREKEAGRKYVRDRKKKIYLSVDRKLHMMQNTVYSAKK